VIPEKRILNLQTSSLVGLVSVVQDLICNSGLDGNASQDIGFDICEADPIELLDTQLPTLQFDVPYQEFSIPTPEGTSLVGLFTTYYWRFRTYNGTYTSGYTGWSRFKKYF